MNQTLRVFRYGVSDVIRRRWVVGYTLLFLTVTEGLLWLGGAGSRLAVSLLDVMLLVIPLVSITFGALYIYNARRFLELLLSQPVSRRELFCGLWAALVLPLVGAFLIGVGIPLATAGAVPSVAIAILGTGVALTVIFVALGLYVAASIADRIKGLGLALAIWMSATILYDGFVLILASLLGARSAAVPILATMLLNPVDLARLLLLTRLDAPALMSYTDALVQHLLGAGFGAAAAASALVAWCAVPTALGLRAFERRDW